MLPLKGKQKRYLRAQAHHMTPIFQVGKNGVTKEVLNQIEEALEKRELFKINLLQNTSVTPEEVKEAIESQIDANVVQVIGKVLVVFKPSSKEKYQHYSKEVLAMS